MVLKLKIEAEEIRKALLSPHSIFLGVDDGEGYSITNGIINLNHLNKVLEDGEVYVTIDKDGDLILFQTEKVSLNDYLKNDILVWKIDKRLDFFCGEVSTNFGKQYHALQYEYTQEKHIPKVVDELKDRIVKNIIDDLNGYR